MANNTFSLLLVSLLVGFLLCACDAIRLQDYKANDRVIGQNQNKDYCVAIPSAPPVRLQAFLDYACGKFDCSAIQPNAPCFLPDNVVSHASYALDAEYRTTGACNSEVGQKTTQDPSSNGCHYP